jgi:hypothetical protein
MTEALQTTLTQIEELDDDFSSVYTTTHSNGTRLKAPDQKLEIEVL